jgi:hypothetical protein
MQKSYLTADEYFAFIIFKSNHLAEGATVVRPYPVA